MSCRGQGRVCIFVDLASLSTKGQFALVDFVPYPLFPVTPKMDGQQTFQLFIPFYCVFVQSCSLSFRRLYCHLHNGPLVCGREAGPYLSSFSRFQRGPSQMLVALLACTLFAFLVVVLEDFSILFFIKLLWYRRRDDSVLEIDRVHTHSPLTPAI